MQVTVTIRSIEQKFPGGTVGGEWRITISPAADPGNITAEYVGAAPSTVFDLPEGEAFMIHGARLDAGGETLGPIIMAQFTVGEDLVPIDVANSISAVSMPGTRAAKK